MKTISFGLAILFAGLAVASGAQAQDNKIKARRAQEAALEANHEKGMKMAPAMIAGQKLFCTMTDARYITSGPSDLNGKKLSTEFVEVACEKNLGYVVGARRDGTFIAYDCIEMSARGADGKDQPLKCKLEGNRVPPRGFQPQLDAAGVKCAISGGRFIGFTSTASIYELGCSKADGLILTVATPRTATSAIRAVPCVAVIKSETPCTMTKPEQSETYAKAAAAAAPKPVDPAVNLQKGMTMAPAMLAENQIPCKVAAANYLFSAKATIDGKQVDADFVEVACENDLGYVMTKRKDNSFTAYDCITTSRAGADGKDHPLKCKLPGNARPYEGIQAAVNTGAAPCRVTDAIAAGLTGTTSIYEVACADADGQLVVLGKPRIGAPPAQFVTCYSQMSSEQACLLTTKEQTVGYIMALAAKAPKPCKATDQRFVTRAPSGSRYYEFACPDKTGFMVEANAAGTFVRAIPCAAAIKIAGGCKLTGGPAA